MQWAISKSHESIGVHGEKLPVKELQGIGDKRVKNDGSVATVGAGGWGGGVRLSTSDQEIQRRNREKLDLFLQQKFRKSGDK